MTEVEKLNARLKGSKSFYADWTVKGMALSDEEKAKIINDSMDRIEAGDYEEMHFGKRPKNVDNLRTPPKPIDPRRKD